MLTDERRETYARQKKVQFPQPPLADVQNIPVPLLLKGKQKNDEKKKAQVPQLR